MKKIYILLVLIIVSIYSYDSLLSVEMKFVENKGQWNEEIKFVTERNGLITSVTNSGIYFDFFQKENNRIKGDVLKLNLINSKSFHFSPIDELNEKYNYFLGNDHSKWVSDVNTYKKLIAENVYEGIDFVYYIDNNNPRYDFIIEPHASTDQIELQFEGITNIKLNNEIIELITPSVVVENSNLFAYQMIDGNQKQVECKFVLNNNKISFKVGEYDTSKELIIDPIIYSSYFGSSGDDKPNRVRYIDENNILLVGSTTSIDFRTTSGSYDVEYGDRTDAFVTKIKVVNAEYIPEFTTYLGSLEYDEAIDVEFTNEYILVTGVTESPDFPILSPIMSKHSGGKDIFVTSLSLDGSKLLKSTYFGGNGDDVVVEVSKDRNNYFLFAAHTTSNNIQTIAGPPNSNRKDGIDILMFTMLPSREAISMACYIGGFLDDVPTDIYIDPNNEDIYMTGWTTSSKGSANDFPIYPIKKFGYGGPYDETSNGGKDAFEIILTKNAQSFIISGFLGGDGDDIGRGIYKDPNENIYILGETYNNTKGVNFPVSTGNSVIQGNSDLFITVYNKLEENFGTKTQTRNYSKLIASQGNEVMADMKKHPTLNAFSVVLASDGRFPEINLSELKAKYNIIYTEIDMTIGEVNNAKIFGGNNDEYPVSFDFDKYNSYLIAGYTNSTDFFVSSNAYQTKLSKDNDIVLIRNATGSLNLLSPKNNQSLCVGTEVQISWAGENVVAEDGYDISYSFDANHETFTTLASSIKAESFVWKVPTELSGKKNVRIRVTHNSGIFAQNLIDYEVNEKATLTNFQLVSPDTICIGENITLKAAANGVNVEYTWFKDNKEIGKTTTNEFTINNATVNNSGKYKVSIKNDCPPAEESKTTLSVYVSPNTKAGTITDKVTKNKGETLELTTSSEGVELMYIWQKDGKNLPSQNKKTLTLSNLSLNDAGKYRCMIQGKCGIDSTNESDVVIENIIGSVSISITEIASIYESSTNIYSIEFMSISDYTYEIYDNIGNILEQSIENSNTKIDLNKYSNGVYWIVINKGNKIYREKLIKYN
ncbi:MAG: hypothetical protein CVV25_00445 [Ignavibacteriae bacterium HGW-Ignavibacteriae-4]|nr:MAG: hypothetical protein CVV25_00445 [Ignavibacteriae bacterium HGW-Ignavibacteriae-4]